jgi:hypothetical protein
VFRSQGGRDTLDNLILLCGGCHDLAHGKPVKYHTSNTKLHRWFLQALVWTNTWGMETTRGERMCLSCNLRTETNECMLWEQDVSWDYVCEQWRERMGP